jgi:hypothetical protein
MNNRGLDMRMKMGDFFDRLTILRMKARLDKNAKQELGEFMAEFRKAMGKKTWKRNAHVLVPWIMQLAEVNAKTWIKEASIRKEYSSDPEAGQDLDLAEVGKRALEIRDYNRLRIEAKNAIDRVYGGIPDRKVDHASE